MGQTLWYFYFGSGNAFVYNKGNLAVHFVDVGHGDCTIIQLPDGKIAIIDAGQGEYYHGRVNRYIRTRIKPKRNYIDYLINTHPHDDHLSGLLRITENYKYGQFLGTTEIPELAADPKFKIVPDGYEILGTNYRIKFHAIDDTKSFTDNYGDNVNEYSPIITLEYGAQVFVITGDAGHYAERIFMEPGSTAAEIFGEANTLNRRAERLTTYLQVGHHGSRSSTGNPFLEFLNPKYAIIPSGEYSKKQYGHPHPEVTNNLNSYRDGQITTYNTRLDGHIVVRVDGNRVKFFFAFDNPPDLTFIWVFLILSSLLPLYIVVKKVFKNT